MKRTALVAALLALALTACGQKAAEAPAVAVVVTPAAPAPVAAPEAAPAPVAASEAAPAPVAAPVAADAMKK